MEKKRLHLMLVLLLISVFYTKSHSATIFSTAKHVVVIYKILDPLTVKVDAVEKLMVSAVSTEPFVYSNISSKRKPINIKVTRPFNSRDTILDAIFSKATLEIQNQGIFELIEVKDTAKKIKAKGYFSRTKNHKVTIPLTSGGALNRYEGNTDLDVEFNNTKEKIEMGTYKGVLKVDVLYGG